MTTTSFCEDMGYLGSERRVCYDDLGFGARVEQHGWNVLAALAGTIWPSLFSPDGAWQHGPLRSLVVPTVIAVLAALAAVRQPRIALPLLSLVVFNAILGLMLYRTRNQIVGMAGLYAAAGIGFAELARLAERSLGRWRTVGSLAALALALGWMSWHAANNELERVDDFRARTASLDPCLVLRSAPRLARKDVVRRIKAVYGLPDPDCSEEPSGG